MVGSEYVSTNPKFDRNANSDRTASGNRNNARSTNCGGLSGSTFFFLEGDTDTWLLHDGAARWWRPQIASLVEHPAVVSKEDSLGVQEYPTRVIGRRVPNGSHVSDFPAQKRGVHLPLGLVVRDPGWQTKARRSHRFGSVLMIRVRYSNTTESPPCSIAARILLTIRCFSSTVMGARDSSQVPIEFK
jgi:hypothetical protein